MAQSAASMLTEAFKKFGDESLTVGEQWGQALSGIASAAVLTAGSISASYKDFSTAKQRGDKAGQGIAAVSMALQIGALIGEVGGEIIKALHPDKMKSEAEKAREAHDRAQESIAATQKSVKDVASEYDNLEASVSKYRNTRNILDQMAEGTDAWKEKVIELNGQVSELLVKYPKLAQYVHTNENGVFEVEEAGWDKLLEEQNKQIEEAQRSASLANMQGEIARQNLQSKESLQAVREASFASNKEHLTSDETFGTAAAVGGLAGAAGGLAIAGAINVWNPLGWAALIAAAVVGIVGIAAGSDAAQAKKYKKLADEETKKVEEAVNKINTEEKLEQYSKAKNIDDIRAIEGLGDITDKTAEALLENNKILVKHITELQNNSRQLEQMKKAYLQSLGKAFGITDTVTYGNISADDLTESDLNRENYLKNYIIAGKNDTVKGEKIGSKIDTSDNRKYASIALNEWIKQAYGIEGTVTGEDLDGLTQKSFEEKEFTLSDGRKVTGQQIREAAATKAMETRIAELTQEDIDIINSLEEAGKDTHLAYFMGHNTVEQWKDTMTLAGLQATQTSAVGVAGVRTQEIDDEIEKEENRIRDFIKENELTYSIDTLSRMTAQDRSTFKGTLSKARNANRGDDLLDLLDQYKDDPEKFASVARQAAAVDFNDKYAAGTFFFEQDKQNVIKLRQKELDYFKNINAELDKVNRELEHAVGLEKQRLLDRQVALEQEAQIQAAQESQDAKQFFNNYVKAHGENELYLNKDGSLNIKAVNDKIATLDEESEADKAELDYLNNLLNYWGDVIDAEAAAEEAAYKVIDAQMAAFNYQFEAWEHLQEISKKYTEFVADMQKIVGQGFGAFDEESIKDRLEAAEEVWKDSFVETVQSELGKASSELSWLLGEESAVVTKLSEEDKEYYNYLKQIDEAVAKRKVVKDSYDQSLQNLDAVREEEKKYDYNLNAEYKRLAAEYNKEARKWETSALSNYHSLESFANGWGDFNNSSYSIVKEQLIDAGEENVWENFIQPDIDYLKAHLDQAKGIYNSKISGYRQTVAAYVLDSLKAEQWKKDAAYYEGLYSAPPDVSSAQYEAEAKEFEYNQADKELNNLLKEYENWLTTTTLANAFNLDVVYKEDGTIDYEALKTSVGKKIAWLDVSSGKIDESILSESIENDFDSIMEKMTKLQNSLKEMYDIWLDAQDQILELYDKEIEKLSNINSILKGSADLSKLLGKSTAGYYHSITSNLQTTLEHATASMKALQAEQKTLYDSNGNLLEGVTQEMVDKVSENLAKASKNVVKITQDLLGSIADEFSAKIGEAIDNAFEKATSLDLIDAKEDWELALQSEEGYLDEVNATYGIDTLSRNIQKSIDETDNAAAQKKLMDLRMKQEERLNAILQERGKLSQYELDRANAEYELTLKQIALEESQQNANKMKLTRDAMGNYSYQYVTDQDKIAEAEAELAEAQNNLYNIDKERNKTLVSEYYSIWTEYQSKLDEATREGDKDRVQRLHQYYLGGNGEEGVITAMKRELGIASENMETIGRQSLGDDSWISKYAKISQNLAKMPLNELAENINSYISATTGEGSIFSHLDGTFKNIESLLSGENGFTASLELLEKSLIGENGLTTQVREIQTSTQDILNQVPILTSVLDPLVKDLKTYTENYTKWLESQTEQPEIQANTRALEKLTIVMEDLTDGVVNGKIKINDQDSELEFKNWKFNDEQRQWKHILENE